jgi:hypothetical protein
MAVSGAKVQMPNTGPRVGYYYYFPSLSTTMGGILAVLSYFREGALE